jgi:pre-mRNA-processing factor 17
VSYWDTETG